MTMRNYVTGPAAGEYDIDPENQLEPEDTLIDRGGADLLDEGYSPPEQPYAPGAFGSFETLEQRLAEEEPDPAARVNVLFDDAEQQLSDESERADEFPRRDEVGRRRAGRLMAPDRGFGEDDEAEMVAEDVGLDGGAASAEEAAVHLIDDDADDSWR
ncbi:DUF5709 domain-containing protein [Mycolicibacterium chlorophenolicum]|nr:DUF5709 domain-containing protein [Mycolicibacterium chlorophenolicum]